MVLMVGLTLALFSLPVPQGGEGAQNQPVLSAAEQKSLNKKLADLIESQKTWDEATGNKRDSASRKHEKAKEAFMKEWESRCEKTKTNLLASVPDLRAIFANVLPYDRASGSGTLKKEELKDARAIEKTYALFVPKSYKPEVPVRTVVVIPGSDAAGNWVECRDWFRDTWDNAAALADTLFNVIQVPKGFDLDSIPDFSKPGDDGKENSRIALVLASWGSTVKTYNLDRDRLFLDCGKGSSGFGLRLASMFPDRFAGIVLRDVPDVDGIRLGSLNGMAVAIVAPAADKAAATKLEQRLNGLYAGACTVIEAKGEYPFAASTADIETWMGGVKRNLMQPKIVVEPNHPRFTKAYWVTIDRMESIAGIPLGQRARIEVEADRKQNRINVKSSGVEAFSLLLNDELVDLDKEVTVVINDKAVVKKRGRELSSLIELVYTQKLDTGWLFPTTFDCKVPKPEPKTGEAGDK